MRCVILFLALLAYGCDARVVHETVLDPSENHRLVLIFREMDRDKDRVSHDFDSIAWQTRTGSEWKDHVVVTQKAFQAGCLKRRWVSEIQSLDPVQGTAILKVAEGDAPENARSVGYVYLWREWDLQVNKEIRVIRVCKKASEKY